MNPAVSFDDCKAEVLDRAQGQATEEYKSWRKRRPSEVVNFVETFRHEHLFQITKADVNQLKDKIRRNPREHALGNVQKEEQLQDVEDESCPFAFMHVFHKYIEDHHSLPLWQDFRAWLNGPAHDMYVGPMLENAGAHKADEEGNEKQRRAIGRALQWRIGNKYYSALREIEFLARMREDYGIHLRYHLLADVLLRTDFWHGDDAVCVYFPNRRYRSGENTGRKRTAEEFLQDADPPFNVRHFEVCRQGYGRLWTPEEADLQNMADILRSGGAEAS